MQLLSFQVEKVLSKCKRSFAHVDFIDDSFCLGRKKKRLNLSAASQFRIHSNFQSFGLHPDAHLNLISLKISNFLLIKSTQHLYFLVTCIYRFCHLVIFVNNLFRSQHSSQFPKSMIVVANLVVVWLFPSWLMKIVQNLPAFQLLQVF